jgi:ankyrin repeat protein
MPRKLKRFIQVNNKILTKKANFIIVHTEEEFNEKRLNKPWNDNIHFLIAAKHDENLLWQKSRGPISNLKDYLITGEEFCLPIDEKQILNENHEKILIISAEPGMGKSLILDRLTQFSSAENFYIKILLNSCTKTLNDLKNKKCEINDPIDFVFKSLLNNSQNYDQEIPRLVKHLAREEKLILMFDGLDEVTDYKEQVIQIIEALISNDKGYRLKKILITTRNHLREDLEDHFQTIAYNLNNYSDEDQKDFLYKYWRNLNLKYQERAPSAKLKQSAVDLILEIKSIFPKNLSQLIGIPLQTKMLADIYIDKVNSKKRSDLSKIEITNIADLYNQFLEKKVRIQYEEKSKIEIDRDQDRFDEDKEKFFEKHIKLSSSILFEDRKEALNLDLNEKDEKRIIKYGVIVAFTNKTPLFLHQSFAEFFVAKSSFTKLEQNKDNDIELEQILRDRRHFLIRKFLNDLLEKKQPQNKINISPNSRDLNEEISNCCSENLISLLKYFIEQKGVNFEAPNTFLIKASMNGRKEMVSFLTGQGIDVNQQDERGLTALIWALQKGHIEIVQELLQNEKIDVNQQEFLSYSALISAAEEGEQEIVRMLLKNENIDINLRNVRGSTALITASANGHIEIVEMLLQHKNVQINQQNKIGYTALMWAAENEHKEIVDILLRNENINVNLKDHNGYTALINATTSGQKEIVQMLLKHKGIQINHQDRQGHSALMWATIKADKEIVELLLEDKSIDVNLQEIYGKTALIWATKEGYKDIVQMLLKNEGIDINHHDREYVSNTALMWAYEIGHTEIVEMLFRNEKMQINQQDKSGQTTLVKASKRGIKDLAHMLLQHKNIDVNQQDKDGKTALMWASEKGHKEIVQMLLQHKDINVNLQDNGGATALMFASIEGHKDIVQMLLQNKDIDVNLQEKEWGRTALIWVCKESHTNIVQILLENENIDINKQDEDGNTALMVASSRGYTEIVQILLQDNNIDINQLNKDGQTALILASEQGHKDIVEMLEVKMK